MTTTFTNLASERLGAQALECSDDFFAEMGRMLCDTPPVFIPEKYDDHGKWMDGWESRRKRGPGHDWCIVKLGVPGRIRAVEIDTSHFTGNYPPHASLEAANCDTPDASTTWTEVVPKTALEGDSQSLTKVADDSIYTHVRLNIFPDGGVARLRVYGDPVPQWANDKDAANNTYELSALINGGRILDYNDAHYGNVWTLLTFGRGLNMGDGWETRRRREPGNDWIIIQLGAPGLIERIEVDTAHFKGNYPDRCSLDGRLGADGHWHPVLPESKLEADTIHDFPLEKPVGPFDQVRLNIFPDGGVSRLRVFGRPQP